MSEERAATRKRAYDLAEHYLLWMPAKHTTFKPNGDNYVEVRDLVDAIVDAAKVELRAELEDETDVDVPLDVPSGGPWHE